MLTRMQQQPVASGLVHAGFGPQAEDCQLQPQLVFLGVGQDLLKSGCQEAGEAVQHVVLINGHMNPLLQMWNISGVVDGGIWSSQGCPGHKFTTPVYEAWTHRCNERRRRSSHCVLPLDPFRWIWIAWDM